MKSGYLNVDEMINGEGIWVLKNHQVIKPLMIPYRLFYDEDHSNIPNVFQIRSRVNGSHFTGLRILHRLSDGVDPSNPFYVSVSELKDYFSENFNMVEDFEKNLDYFLKRDIVEANNRIDFYCEEVDSIKITTYGLYIFRTLSSYFTYLELVSTDCGYFNERISDEMVAFSNQEFNLFKEKSLASRVHTRLKKTEIFIDYLIEEEQSENDFFNLANPSNFAGKIRDDFINEKEVVLRSLAKRRYRA